uniref:Uncharacterized protein n=1 Tax=Schistocephalus solidus TaxID=70667 RepID=A0A0X3PI84_SCHSO
MTDDPLLIVFSLRIWSNGPLECLNLRIQRVKKRGKVDAVSASPVVLCVPAESPLGRLRHCPTAEVRDYGERVCKTVAMMAVLRHERRIFFWSFYSRSQCLTVQRKRLSGLWADFKDHPWNLRLARCVHYLRVSYLETRVCRHSRVVLFWVRRRLGASSFSQYSSFALITCQQ